MMMTTKKLYELRKVEAQACIFTVLTFSVRPSLGVAGAAARVGATKHLDPLRQRVDALVGCQGETN